MLQGRVDQALGGHRGKKAEADREASERIWEVNVAVERRVPLASLAPEVPIWPPSMQTPTPDASKTMVQSPILNFGTG